MKWTLNLKNVKEEWVAPRNPGLSAKKEIAGVIKETVDRLLNLLESRSVLLQEIDEKFRFLFDMKGLCFKAESSCLKERC